MLSDKTVLLERINIAINKKWNHKNAEIFALHVEKGSAKDDNEPAGKNYFTHSKNAASIERLEDRIEALENQQDQLFCFVNFLVENLPDLVLTILHGGEDAENGLEHPAGSGEICESPFKTNCCQGKMDPCPTRREMDVLELLVKGFCAKEIAVSLFISETTVITHKKNLKEKFNARNTVELISKAQPHLSKNNK